MIAYSIQNISGEYPRSAKSGSAIWWSSEAQAQQAYTQGYGAGGSKVVKVEVRVSPFGYNGYSIWANV